MANELAIGWLGTGRMGAAMSRRLIDAGHDVTVWNRTRSKTDDLAAAGAKVADTKVDLAEAVDVVFIMVSRPSDLEEVIAGDGGLLSAGSLPKVIVDCSSVSPEVSAEVRKMVTDRGVAFLASPISGNPHVVAEGQSILMASGDKSTYDLVAPLLNTISKTSVYVGDGEQARIVKICHNLYLGMLVQGLSEVTVLAEKSGVPRSAFLEFLNNTVLATDWVRKRTPDMLALDWTPTFTTELLRKDFDLGLAVARDQEVPMPMGAGVMQLIQAAIMRGHRDDDFLSLFAEQADSAGMKLEAEK
ncbi:NAD(P)-dependent oxidoreductase [Histidinibacterium aquaticum]|uniref:NAD(P)-dependent oxidoreductase n=1 Tax=Histidinibacterium aquaticum TaxID=2613962 RepID=A0A5J5GC32_9RHOB|nr:NAD(P)-dependent oxidoreductase [Histidinibacterium aquaticum]KAA9005729.1 NAD(P)-dependent oxidoreductase [Histidinibacterium aquaticum]